MEFRILGAFDVVSGGRTLRIGGLKPRALLALLALRANEVVALDVIIDSLWGERVPPSAREVVRTYVSRLRQLLAEGDDVHLITSPGGYMLQVDATSVDAVRFEGLVAEAQDQVAALRLDEALTSLTAALGLWRGAALDDLREVHAFAPAVARLEEMRLTARERLIDVRLELGHHADVVGELMALTTEHPLREQFWRSLIVALYRCGRQTDALATYQTLRSTLIEQVGIDPSPELRALEGQVLNQSVELDWRPTNRHVTSASPSWPLQIGRPPVRAKAFQPRLELMDPILMATNDPEPRRRRHVIMVGNGGVGKTQLASAVLSEAREAGTDLLIWVNASSREAIVATYAQAREALDPSSRRTASGDEAAEALQGWLATTSRSWLVVLDDVRDPAHVHGLWPEGGSGRVVATTRRRDFLPGDAHIVPIGVFTPTEAVRYLEERLTGSTPPPHPRVVEEAAGLARDLAWLPVALAQAAGAILNDGITCGQYQRRFADRSTDLLELFPLDVGADEYSHPVSTTWSLALDRADALQPGGLARPALHIAALLDPDGAPDSIWCTTSVRRLLDRGRGHDVDLTPSAGHSDSDAADRHEASSVPRTTAYEARKALRNLHRLSLIEHEPAGGPLAVRTHALVQRTTLDALSPEHRARLVRVAADALAEIWPRSEQVTEHSRVLRQNALALAERDSKALWTDGAHDVLLRVGESLGRFGRVHDAVVYWSDLATTAARGLGADHPDSLAIRAHLTDWRGESGDADGAVSAFEELAGDFLRVLGPGHPDTLAIRHAHASWRGATGDAAGAVAALEALVQDRGRVLGADHPDTLATRNHLADWRGAAGDAAGAVAELHELVDDCRRILGPGHRETLATRNHLADWRGAAGDAAGAVAALEALVQDTHASLGVAHPDSLAIRHLLASWRGAAGDAATAVEELRRLIAQRSGVAGPDHPETLRLYYSLAHWSGVAGDAKGATDILTGLLDARRRVLGDRHPDTLTTRHALAWWQGVTGDPGGAATAVGSLVNDLSGMLGPDHRQTLATRNHLYHWQGIAGDTTGTITALHQLVDDYCRILGPDHPDTLAIQRSLTDWRTARRTRRTVGSAQESSPQDRLRVPGFDQPHLIARRLGVADWRLGRRWVTRWRGGTRGHERIGSDPEDDAEHPPSSLR